MNKQQTLKELGLRVTTPRTLILQVLEQSSEHLSAENIHQILLKQKRSIGLATVYRVLMQFEQAGIVLRHNFEGDCAVYELDDGGHHDHMVCVETGKVIEFCNEEIERIQEKIAKEHGYKLVDHTLMLYVKPKK